MRERKEGQREGSNRKGGQRGEGEKEREGNIISFLEL